MDQKDSLKKFVESNKKALQGFLKWKSFELGSCRTFSFMREGIVVFKAHTSLADAGPPSFMHDRGSVSNMQYCFGVFDAKTGKLLETNSDIADAFKAGAVSSLAEALNFFDAVASPTGKRITSPTSGMFGNPGANAPRLTSDVLTVEYQTHVGMRGPVFKSYVTKFPTKDEPKRFDAGYAKLLKSK